MKYLTVNQIINAADSIEAINYLKELWYANAEDIFSLSLNYQTFKHQFSHLRASAPNGWKLNWDGKHFYLSKSIINHGDMCIVAQTNGGIFFHFN